MKRVKNQKGPKSKKKPIKSKVVEEVPREESELSVDEGDSDVSENGYESYDNNDVSEYTGEGDNDDGFGDNDSMIDNGTDESSGSEDDEKGTTLNESQPIISTLSKKQKRKANKKGLFQVDKEVDNLYHSELFRSQLETLLVKNKASQPPKLIFDQWIADLNDFLKSLPTVEPKTFEELLKSDVIYPLETKIQDLTKSTFEFVPPTKDLVIIDPLTGCPINSETINVYIAVTMPFSLSKKDDYLNQRIIHKKAYYLQVLAENLKDNTNLCKAVKFNYFKSDPLRPVLEIEPQLDGNKEILVTLMVLMDDESFKLSRFIPSTNNVRSYMARSESDTHPPTPHYNYELLYDLTFFKNLERVEETINQSQSLRDAVTLLRTWFKLRHFDEGFHTFDGLTVAMIVCHLIQAGKISPAMTPYQIVRLVWYNLSLSQWDKQGVTLCTFNLDPKKPELKDFHTYFDVVFLDFTGYMNVMSYLSVDLYRLVKHEAQQALKCLDNRTLDSFRYLFLTHYPAFVLYDQILTIKNYNVIMKIVQEQSSVEDKVDMGDNWYPTLRKLIMKIIKRGLGNRVKHLVPISYPTVGYDVTTPLITKPIFSIGLVLDPDEALNILDKGPQANESDATEYREFWGEKAELRRFKDGSITESCIWTAIEDPPGEKRLVCKKICYHLLKRHFKIPEVCLHFAADQFDIAIRAKGIKINDTGEGRHLNAVHAFDRLAKEMRRIATLPLSVKAVAGCDPTFRYCDLEAPLANARPFKTDSMEVMLASKSLKVIFQVETSGKWPDELDEFRKYKAEFCSQVANALKIAIPKSKIQILLEYFYIMFDGYVFRVEMFHPKELHLMKETIAPNKISKIYKDNKESLQMERNDILVPKLTSCLHGLHSQYPSFGPAVNIAKRWLYSHHIDSYLWPDEATELIMASLYLRQEELTPAIQPQTSFFRFLNYIAHTDWTSELVLVNFNDIMNPDKIHEVKQSFSKQRTAYPALSIITTCDGNRPSLWTKEAPIVEIIRFVGNLAQSALSLVTEDILILCPKRIKPIFTPNFAGFNLLIHLKEELLVPSCVIPVDRFTTPKEEFVQKKLQAVDYNAVEIFLRKVRETYREFALFFYDPCEGTKIAVLWKPKGFIARPNKPRYSFGRTLKGNKFIADTDVIIDGFEKLGSQLQIIDKIEVLTDKLQA